MPSVKLPSCIRHRIKPLAIAIFHWLITTLLQIDKHFFQYDSGSIRMYVIKVFYLISLMIMWGFLFHAWERIRQGNIHWKRGCFVFAVYFSIAMVLLLLLWPGTWAWDDVNCVNLISSYQNWIAWYHWLSGLHLSLLLQFIPTPGGIILMQNLIISLCVAFCVVKLESIFDIRHIGNKAVDVFFKLLPFLLPPVIFYQFAGARIGLYVYLEMTMLVMLIDAMTVKHKWSREHMLLFCLLCMIVSTWRSESIFYLPLVCILLFFVPGQMFSMLNKFISLALIISGFGLINYLQKKELGNDNYKVMGLVGPCTALIQHADTIADAQELCAIGKVLDVQRVLEHPDRNGESLYSDMLIPKLSNIITKEDTATDDNLTITYTHQDYQDFFKAFIALAMKYPQVVFMERRDIFYNGTGITTNVHTLTSNAALLFDEGHPTMPDSTSIYHSFQLLRKRDSFFSPVSEKTRKHVILALGVWPTRGFVASILRRYAVWNAIIPELILIILWMSSLIRKKWLWAAISSTLLIKLLLVFLTAPSLFFFYHLSFYITGYTTLIYGGLILWSHRQIAKDSGCHA